MIVDPYAHRSLGRGARRSAGDAAAGAGAAHARLRANVSAFDSRWWAEQLLRDAGQVSRRFDPPQRGGLCGVKGVVLIHHEIERVVVRAGEGVARIRSGAGETSRRRRTSAGSLLSPGCLTRPGALNTRARRPPPLRSPSSNTPARSLSIPSTTSRSRRRGRSSSRRERRGSSCPEGPAAPARTRARSLRARADRPERASRAHARSGFSARIQPAMPMTATKRMAMRRTASLSQSARA